MQLGYKKEIFTAFALASVYYLSICLIFQILLGLAEVTAPGIIWVALAVTIGMASVFWPGRKLTRWPLLRSETLNFLPMCAFVGLATVMSICVLIVQGALFGLRAHAPVAAGPVTPVVGIAISIASPVFAAFIEEVAFRGILQSRLSQAMSFWRSIALTSILFIFAHLPNAGFAAQSGLYVGVSFTCGYIAQRNRSVAPAIAVHLLVNLILTLTTLYWGVIEMARIPVIEVEAAAVVGVVALGLMALLGRAGRHAGTQG